MKSLKKSLIGVASAAVLTVAAVPANAVFVEWIYDGFCDGGSLNINGTGGGISTGTYASSCSTCPFTEQIAGSAGKMLGQGVTSVSFSFSPALGANIWSVIRNDGTWTHYNYDGTVFNSGTWTNCNAVKPNTAGFAPSTQ